MEIGIRVEGERITEKTQYHAISSCSQWFQLMKMANQLSADLELNSDIEEII